MAAIGSVSWHLSNGDKLRPLCKVLKAVCCTLRSSHSSQSQQQLFQEVSPSALLDGLDLPQLDDLLADPIWQELTASQADAGCAPGCSCEGQKAQTSKRQPCRRAARKQGPAHHPAGQLLSSWVRTASPTSSGSTVLAAAQSQELLHNQTEMPAGLPSHKQAQADYPSSSQDSNNRPSSPAEALKDTSCTPAPSHPGSSCLPQPGFQADFPAAAPQQQHAAIWPPAPLSPTTPAGPPPAQHQQPFQFGQQPLAGSSQQAGGGQQAGAGIAKQVAEEESEDAKRVARMQRNRESAHYSRQRKKMQTHDLERRNNELHAQNTHLTGENVKCSGQGRAVAAL